ncbi:MAG: hypothetical protein Q9187_002892, partial [Circinaria calcarea]
SKEKARAISGSGPPPSPSDQYIDEKVERLLKAVKGGYNIRFVPNDENGRYEVFARKSSSTRSHQLTEQSAQTQGNAENDKDNSLPVSLGNHIYRPMHDRLLQSPYPLPWPARPTNLGDNITDFEGDDVLLNHGIVPESQRQSQYPPSSPSTTSITQGLEHIRFEEDVDTPRRDVVPGGSANSPYPRRAVKSPYPNRASRKLFNLFDGLEEGTSSSSIYVPNPGPAAAPQMTWGMMVAEADRKWNIDQAAAKPDRPRQRRVQGPMNLNLSSSENPGTAVRHESREDQDGFDRPIPIDWHKDRENLATPSFHSTGTELDCSSPCFEKSCLTIKKQAYLEAPLPSDIVSRWIDTVRSPLEDVDDETSDNDSAESTTSSAFWEEALYSAPVDLWEDVLRNRDHSPPIEYNDKVAVASQGHSNMPVLRRAGYLEHNSFFREGGIGLGISFSPRDETEFFEEDSILDSSNESSYFLETHDGILDRVVEASILQHGNKTTETRQSNNNTGTSYLSSSSKTTNDNDAAEAAYHAANHARALACLEGRPFKQRTRSPILRYAHPEGYYGTDVKLEKRLHNVPVSHPKPRRAYPTVHFKKLEIKATLGAWMLDAVSSTPSEYRPENPTPRRAKDHNGWFAVDKGSMTEFQRELDSWRSFTTKNSVDEGTSEMDSCFI